MPRSIRIEYPGAIYHVMCRGDRREAIVGGDEDRALWSETLAEACGRTGFVIHAYVLMPNHYHVLLETPEGNLVAGMKWLQGTYTQRFNARHRLVGHLFQGRYKAVPVDGTEPAYFRLVSQYIHFNPVRTGMLRADQPLRSYPWSSYPALVAQAKLPPWLCRARLFSSYGLRNGGRNARRRYEQLMERLREDLPHRGGERVSAGDWEPLRRGWYLGNDVFRDWLMNRADSLACDRKRDSYRPEGLRLHDERAADQVLNVALNRLGLTRDDVREKKQSDPVKQALAWWVKRNTVVGDAWICAALDMGARSNVSRAVSAFRLAPDQARKALKSKLHICTD